MKALLVGGTGPTGVPIAHGLVDRGFELTILHRGVHEPPGLPDCEHIHADPHFRETLDAALVGRRFELVVATYGRLRHVAEAVAGRCDRFVSVGGSLVNVGVMAPWELRPFGSRIPWREEEDLAEEPGGPEAAARNFGHKIWQAENRVLQLHRDGAFSACHFRYSLIYGPRQPSPREWSIVKRVLDGRRQMILADGGLEILSRLAARNAAEYILLGVDKPEAAAGQIFNCADERQYSLRQLLEMTVDLMGGEMQMVSLPYVLAKPARAMDPLQKVASHFIVDTTKARERLGYRDAIDPREALRQTVEWLIANPVAAQEFPHDPFDYEAEDRLIAAYQAAVAEIERDQPFNLSEGYHPYAHPKTPNAGSDHRGR